MTRHFHFIVLVTLTVFDEKNNMRSSVKYNVLSLITWKSTCHVNLKVRAEEWNCVGRHDNENAVAVHELLKMNINLETDPSSNKITYYLKEIYTLEF